MPLEAARRGSDMTLFQAASSTFLDGNDEVVVETRDDGIKIARAALEDCAIIVAAISLMTVAAAAYGGRNGSFYDPLITFVILALAVGVIVSLSDTATLARFHLARPSARARK
jgi:hypothetical protein